MDKEKATKDLRIIVDFLRYTIEQANIGGKAKLGIMQEFPDGDGGRIFASFDPTFVEALAVLVDAEPLTDERRKQLAAKMLLAGIVHQDPGKPTFSTRGVQIEGGVSSLATLPV